MEAESLLKDKKKYFVFGIIILIILIGVCLLIFKPFEGNIELSAEERGQQLSQATFDVGDDLRFCNSNICPV